MVPSMALCLADSLLAKGNLDPHDLMQRFVSWWREGENSPVGRCFDIGTTAYAALAQFERTGDPISGDPRPNAAGNGSLMRLSPIALFFKDDETQARAAARRQSETTHAATECLDACDWFSSLLVRAINGTSFEDLLGNTCTGPRSAQSPMAPGGRNLGRRFRRAVTLSTRSRLLSGLFRRPRASRKR